MQMGHLDKLIYSYKSQVLAEGEDQKNMGMKDKDVILENELRSLSKD